MNINEELCKKFIENSNIKPEVSIFNLPLDLSLDL